MLQVEYISVNDIELLHNNPRTIKDDDFKRLCDSVKKNKQFFEARPIILSDRTGSLVVIAGNQRLRAAKEIGMNEVPSVLIPNLTYEQETEIVFRDNISNGEFDWDIIANEFSDFPLEDWGVGWDSEDNYGGVAGNGLDGDKYTTKIETPTYEITGDKPSYNEMVQSDKYEELINEIEKSDIDNDAKIFLKKAAERHRVFNYENIAEYYAHAPAEVQDLMEKSALVIIDYDKSIEYGFNKLTSDINDSFSADYPEYINQELNDEE